MTKRERLIVGLLLLVSFLDITPSAQIRAGLVNLATMVTGDLPFANLTQGSALSVLGVTGNSTADVASIAAGSDGQALRRSGTSLAFGTIATAGISDDAVTNAKLDNMAALTVKVRAANSSGDPSDVALTDGHTAKRVGTAITSATYGPVSVSVLTSGTGATYTVPAGVYRLVVHVQGPGGGGGGGDQGGAGACGAAGGGGGGGYANKTYSVTPGQTFTYTIGLKGTGGTAGNNAGNNGTANTVFDSGGSPVTGGLGNGGASMAAGTGLAAAVGGAGGSATGGDKNIAGVTGDQAIRTASNVFRAGQGGLSGLGLGSAWVSSGAANGVGYGSGGGGGSAFTTTADVAGGDGTDGVIIVEEFN